MNSFICDVWFVKPICAAVAVAEEKEEEEEEEEDEEEERHSNCESIFSGTPSNF